MALPELTPEQRAEALAKAAVARRERAAVKNRLKNAQGSLAEVLAEGERLLGFLAPAREHRLGFGDA